MYLEIRKHIDRLPSRDRYMKAVYVVCAASYKLEPDQKAALLKKLNDYHDYEKAMELFAEVAKHLSDEEMEGLSRHTEDMVHQELGEPEMYSITAF